MARGRRLAAVALASAVVLGVAACGGGDSGDAGRDTPGVPVSGGHADVVELAEPRGLDPAAMSNAWAATPFVGNALYGTLLTNDATTGEIKPSLALGFTSADGGTTFVLKLRPGLKFSDGTPLTAAAVKFNWDRLADPAVGSDSLPEAAMVAATGVVDDTTLQVTMKIPVPNYAQAVVSGSMNWIAAPAALREGSEAFNRKPVGAGPYTLKSWQRQGAMELVRNPGYWDAPKPYIENYTVRTVSDAGQRQATMLSGGADIGYEANWGSVADYRDNGIAVEVMPFNGATYAAMNTRRAPFDDIRARQAVAAALDVQVINQSVYQGKGDIPRTLFRESSPFFADVRLTREPDRATAQRLFDELAAEGKPVSFTFKAFPTTETKLLGESIQAQLSTFRNVQVKVETVDFAQTAALRSSHDFDMVVTSLAFLDPEPRLWTALHGDSGANMSGLNDPRLNEALQTGRRTTDGPQRKAAYQEAQQRVRELIPGIFYITPLPAVAVADNVHGTVFYGNGSLLPEELWTE